MPQPNNSTPQPEPVPVEPEPVAPQPVEPEPVSLEPAPEPVPVDAAEIAPAAEDDVDEPISLVETDGEGGTSKIRARGTTLLGEEKREYARSLNKTGTGATRCRIFHSRIALAPLNHMENSINEWLDSDENLEIKHVGHIIGTMEGKSREPNLIVIAWY